MLTPSPNKKIQAVLFDLGAVLVQLDFNPLFLALGLAKGSTFESVEAMNTWAFYDDFERGKIDEAAFVKAINEKLGCTFSVEAFRDPWNSIIQGGVPGIAEILKNLAAKMPLYVLTNSTAPHMDYARAQFTWLGYFNEIFTSFDLGCRKPELEIYQEVAKRMHMLPGQILFIDDRKDNVEGARRAGYLAEVCEQSPRDVIAILRRYGLL